MAIETVSSRIKQKYDFLKNMNIGYKQVMSGILMNCFHDLNNIAKNCYKLSRRERKYLHKGGGNDVDRLLGNHAAGRGNCFRSIEKGWYRPVSLNQKFLLLPFSYFAAWSMPDLVGPQETGFLTAFSRGLLVSSHTFGCDDGFNTSFEYFKIRPI